MTGDGIPDLLVFDEERVRVYPAIGARGHGPAVLAPRRPDMPVQERGAADELQLFADMSGDGLSDRVRVRDGQVTYWPNLGWGRFGAPIAMAGAPQFANGLDPARVFLADLDGSGAADSILRRASRGYRLLQRERQPLRRHAAAHPAAGAVAPAGERAVRRRARQRHGLPGFLHGTQELRHEFYDFAGGAKPYMLTEVDNRMGALTRVRYAASTKFYLADRAAGRTWLTLLPFPVQVVDQIETIDQIAGSKQISSYSYHHWRVRPARARVRRLWPGRAPRRRGLRAVWRRSAFALADWTPRAPAISSKPGITPVYWSASSRCRANSPRSTTRSTARRCAWTTARSTAWRRPGQRARGVSCAARQSAARRNLRRRRAGSAAHAPLYRRRNSSYVLRLVQPIGDQPYSVYLPLLREEIAYSYEQQPSDPRRPSPVSGVRCEGQSDARGRAGLRPARRIRLYDEQNRARGRYTFRRFLNIGPDDTPANPDVYHLGIPIEVQTFELGGLAPDRGRYYSWATFKRQFCPDASGQGFTPELAAADFHQPPPAGRGARRIGWERSFYWDDAYATGEFSHALAQGAAGPRALLRRVETAVHTLAGAQLALSQPENGGLAPSKHIDIRATSTTTDLSDGGALVIPDGSDVDSRYLWDIGVTAIYGGPAEFFQPIRFEDQWGTRTMRGVRRVPAGSPAD